MPCVCTLGFKVSCHTLKERCIRIPYVKCSPGKGNLMATCPVHFLTSRYLGNFYSVIVIVNPITNYSYCIELRYVLYQSQSVSSSLHSLLSLYYCSSVNM